jgi:tRNA-dihydrouridine synthase A
VEAVREHLGQVDGVMIGRAAYHDPFVLAKLESDLYGTPLPERGEVLERMRIYIEAELARGTQLKHITRHILGLYQGEPGARGFRRQLSEGAHLPGADWGLIEAAMAPLRQAA